MCHADTDLIFREQVRQFVLRQADHLDSTAESIIDAIIQEQDVFRVAHDTQITLMRTQHRETVANIEDTHREIIQEIRVGLLSSLLPHCLIFSCNPSRILVLPNSNRI